MVEFKSYASSSAGNFYTVSDGHTKLMIECGIPVRKIKEALNFKLSEIQGCLASHVHQDHIKAANDIMKAGIDLYALRETIEAADLSGHRVHEIKALKQFRIGTWTIKPFNLIHSVPCVGLLLVSDNGDRLIFITDSQYAPYRFKRSAHILAVECNYDLSILKHNLKTGALALEVAKGVIQNHMSLETCKEFFRVNDMSKVQAIHLLHLSEMNADPAMFKREIQRITGRPVYVACYQETR